MKPTYEELEQQRNELAAQVERLRSSGNVMWDWIVGESLNDIPELKAAMKKWIAVEGETPSASLSAFKAQLQADRSRELAKALGFLGSPRGDTFAWSYLINIVAITKAAAERAQEADND